MIAPKISIIVPIYNAEKSIYRCVESILAQTLKDFELLLIDDGSEDNSIAIIEEFACKDNRIRIFHNPHKGVSFARNVGLDNVKGEWITFADADDFVFPDWLDNFNFNDAKDVDLIQQGAESDKSIWDEFKYSSKCGFNYCGCTQGYVHEIVSRKMVGYLWMKAFRLSIIKKYNLRFDERLTLQEDGVFALNYLLYCSNVKAIDKQGYYYFAPVWRKKYKQSNEIIIYLNKIQVECCKRIFVNDYTAYPVRFFKDSLTNSLMVGFAKNPKFGYLKEIRNLHVKDYDCSRLFRPLKWLIVNDCTYILSWIALLIHSNLRLIRNKQE